MTGWRDYRVFITAAADDIFDSVLLRRHSIQGLYPYEPAGLGRELWMPTDRRAKHRSAVLAGLLVLSTVYGGSGPGPGDAIGPGLSFRRVRLENLHAVPSTNLLWNSEAGLARFWEAHSDAAPPDIDFTRHSVVAVFLGARPNAGYLVRDQPNQVSDGGVSLPPNPERDYAAVVTYPYDAVEPSKVSEDATFIGAGQR